MFSFHHLPNQLPGEKIIKVVRRDLFILFKRIIALLLMMVLPLVFFMAMLDINPTLVNGTLSLPLIILGISTFYLFAWLFFFFSFIDYYLDVWVITNRRIIDVEQEGFFSRTIAEHKLFRIQDVTSEVHGIMATVLKYGDVFIQTAGTKQRFQFHQIPNPDKIRDLVIKLVQENRAEMMHEHHINENIKEG